MPFQGAAVTLLAALSATLLGSQQPAPSQAARDSLARELRLIADDPQGLRLPPVDSITVGARRIEAGTRIPGSVVVARGDLDVYGKVDGNAVAIGGDVIVHPGGMVGGDAVSFEGHVTLAGGTVAGEARAVSKIVRDTGPVAVAPLATTWRALRLVCGWAAMVGVLGLGVLIFAERNLEGVVATVVRDFSKSFWTGLIGQVAIIPVMLLGIIALAITILGIPLIPVAVAAYMLALAGLVALGFLAVAQVAGAFGRRRRSRASSERSTVLRALVTGLTLFFIPWLLAAAFTWAPVLGTGLRALAVVVSWVAATAGFGAALLSRAGTRGLSSPAEVVLPADDFTWQTPTPVAGVVAARRPTPTPPMGER
jgi:hypothetical protein